MAKDYVKRRPQKKRSRAPQLLVVFASFLLGYTTASFLDLSTMGGWLGKHFNPPTAIANEATAKHPEARTVKEEERPPKPKFEFYTLLAKDSNPQVLPGHPAPSSRALPARQEGSSQQYTPPPTTGQNVPAQTTQSPQSPTSLTSKETAENQSGTPGQKDYYLVQVASFNRRADAEQLKASLVLRGFDVLINTTQKGQVTWFRVILGPYSNRGLAERAQQEIVRTNHMNGMIRRMDT